MQTKGYLLFDMDGTITDTMRLIPYLIGKIWKIPPHQFKQLQRYLGKFYYQQHSWFRTKVFRALRALDSGFGQNILVNLVRFFKFGVIYVIWLYLYPPRIFDNALGVLKELENRGYQIYLVTNGSPSEVRRKMRSLDFEFQDIITKKHVKKGRKKPAPDMINLLLKKHQIANKEDVYLIGDTIQDEKSAQAAGIKFVLLETGTFGGQFCETSHRYKSIKQLLEYFK